MILAAYAHPGIYIQEVPGARSIQGASTSTAAFIGVTEKGEFEKPTLITSWNAYQRHFGGLVWNGMVSWAVFEFFNEGGTVCYVVRAKDGNGDGKDKLAKGKAGDITLTAVTPGTWANILKFAISSANGSKDDKSPVFDLSIVVERDAIDKPSTDSSIDTLKAYVAQNNLQPQPVGDKSYYVLETLNGFTEASMSEALKTRIDATSMFVRAELKAGSKTRPPNGVTPLAGGKAASWSFKSATETLDKVQGVSLLAIPDTVNAVDKSGKPSQQQQATEINIALGYCEKVQNLFFVSDPPFGLDVDKIGSFKAGSATIPALNSNYGAIYYPWVWIYNPMVGANVPIPPSGPVLGRYAYTDINVGAWKSPAGVNDGALRSVVQVQSQITDNEQGLLNPNGINAIRNFLNYGNTIWGARTLAAAGSEWTYVSVRRLFIYVEQSFRNSLQWVVFEPNDQQTWASVTRDVSAFLTTLWQAGGLFGASPAEAFFVTCDASNNPPETRMLGQLYIDVGLAPVFPAEFVIIRMSQKIAGPDSGS
ncbi:phage tail sheath family protein [Paraherbaspirillum soli]|uniref:Phage tail sheath family protein n=1 Tax=Paraherbaspirillum soli TaxID=631222 RepID=A0ABW0MD69_9BURK